MAKPTKSKVIKKPIIQRKGVTKQFIFTGIDNLKYTLTEKEKKFCEEYIKPFANSVECIIKAGYDISNRESGRAMASRLLTNVNVSQYMQVLLQDAGLNDTVVDKALMFNIQQTIDLKAKNGAIDQYNKMKGRLAPDKHEHTIIEKFGAMADAELDEIINAGINS